MTTHVKVARGMLTPQGVEFPIPLSAGGEVQLWEKRIWNQYHKYLQDNPQYRCTQHYPWMYIEDINPPSDDLRNYVMLPEKTGGKEFERVTPEPAKVAGSTTNK